MEKILYEERLRANNIDPNIIHNAKQNVKLITPKSNSRQRQRGTIQAFRKLALYPV